ncbi:MAG: hypothetical protein IJ127_06340, partial [Afipia sp.]|nr:hypothetical protein [Afipia sp.]
RIVEAVMFDQPIGAMSAPELLSLSEDAWGTLRDRLTDGARGQQDGLTARCLRCESRVFIQTRKQGERRLPYFVHYRGGDPSCPWHHGSSLSIDEARAAQYQGQQESRTHRMLCEQIDELAKVDVRYVRSTVAQYLPPTENSFGRYPDVYIEWKGLAPFAIEIQLSNTFQTEISARCHHYEREGINLIWVLYGVDPTTDDIPQSFRDVIRRHRGNAFVLDHEAIQASHEQKTIVLKCYLKDGEDTYKPPKLVRIDALTFRGQALPYLEDRITANLKAEIGAQRAAWFKALEPYRDNWERTIVHAPAVRDAIAALSHRFGVISSYGPGEAEEIAVVRLIAIVFTVISAANGHFRNYATRHDNIRAMLNTLLNSVEEMQRYALLIEFLLRHSNQHGLLSGKVGEHIERAKAAAEGNLCLEGEPEWQIMAHLVPEVFNRITREEMAYLDELPTWASIVT